MPLCTEKQARAAAYNNPLMRHAAMTCWGVSTFSEGSVTARLGVRDFEIHWISRGFRISEWISDFKVDFWISKWISGFRSGFLDFKWISGFRSGFLDFKWISGFQSGFLDFKVDFWISSGFLDFKADFWISKRISGFHLNRYYSEDTAKIYSWTIMNHILLSLYANNTMSQALHRYIAHIGSVFVDCHTYTYAYCVFVDFHTYSYHTAIIHNTFDNCNYITLEEWPLYPTTKIGRVQRSFIVVTFITS